MAEATRAERESRRFKRVEYERLAECGFFHPTERLELIDGLMLVREPQGTSHATATTLGLEALRTVFGAGWVIRVQLPIALDDDSEPEPDLVVVRGRARDFSRAHPSSVALLVEVSETSLAFDRDDKAGLYARAGIADYWIVNLIDAVVEIHREPRPAPAAPYGWRFGSIRVARPAETLTPLTLADASLRVVDFLP